MKAPFGWVHVRRGRRKILARDCQKIEGPQVARTTCGPYNQEVTMNLGRRRTVHIDVIIVFDWKMMSVLVSAYVTRLLLK